MPYAANDELPPAVRKRYTDRCQTVFRKAFNAADGDEGSRFRIAHTAARNCMDSTTKGLLPIKAQVLDPEEHEAWFSGKLSRRLLAIPFGGPIKSSRSPIGVDLDDEWFSQRTDLYGNYKQLRQSPERRLDWQHGRDQLMSRVAIGKSILDPDPDEDGWWVDTWLAAGSRHLAMVKRLVERGAQLFGSSEAASKTVDPDTGEILVWPMILETLTPTPVNTMSAFAKAADPNDSVELDAGIAALIADLDVLKSDLSPRVEQTAKAGRVVDDFTAAIERLEEVSNNR